jgi:myo-inositol-1(or 4)-monophosphatase
MEPTTPIRKTQPSSTDSSSEDNGTTSSTPATTPPSTPNFDLILAKHNLSRPDLKKIHLLLIEIAMDGGQMMLDAELALKTAVEHKNNSADVVTEFDKKVEDMVEKRTYDAYPSFGFLGEETFKHGTRLADTPTFVCDPIDGTLTSPRASPNALSLSL